MSNRVHLIIFSKDRALQLDSLLRSIRDNYSRVPESLTILYCASTPDFAAGYDLLQNRQYLQNCIWQEESSFSDDLRTLIAAIPDTDLVQFMTDDDIVFRPFDLSLIENLGERDLFLSLRSDIRYPRYKPPRFLSVTPVRRWQWYHLFARKTDSFWYYPFSVDGNIFHCSDLKRILQKIDFRAPNSFEAALHAARKSWAFFRKRMAIATTEAVIFNNPLNTVQTEGENWHQSVSPECLNQQYLANKIIDNHLLYATEPNEVHYAVGIQFKSFK